MPTHRLPALLSALLLALATGPAHHAEPDQPNEQTPSHTDQQTLEHIRLLEQMLREAGVQPPPRPGTLAQDKPTQQEPILPESFATAVFETESAAINARGDKAANAIKHVRRWLTKDDVKRRVAAEELLETLSAWADQQLAAIDNASDPVDAYILADNAIHLFGQDPLAKPFKQYMKDLQRDNRQFHQLQAMAAYRRAIELAQDIGLLGDWARIDFNNTKTRNDIKSTTTKLKLITNRWPNTDAADNAQARLDDWAAREAQAIADLPAWRYTWQLALIQTGTKTQTTITTTADGTVIIDEDQRPTYDPRQVQLHGTFQNTSDKPYRYTFVAGVSSRSWTELPFNKLNKKQLIGYELIQTPLLQPGELYDWHATVSVNNIQNLHRGGITLIEVHEPKAGR